MKAVQDRLGSASGVMRRVFCPPSLRNAVSGGPFVSA